MGTIEMAVFNGMLKTVHVYGNTEFKLFLIYMCAHIFWHKAYATFTSHSSRIWGKI